MKSCDTHLDLIRHTLSSKLTISKKSKMLRFGFSRLQTYWPPRKVPFATVPNLFYIFIVGSRKKILEIKAEMKNIRLAR